MKIINPATEELIAEIKEDSKESLGKKFEYLKAAQPVWNKVPLTQRVQILKRFC